MPKRTHSSAFKENDTPELNTRDKMIQPFRKKAVVQTDRKNQQSTALAAISKFLNVSDKYAKAWEKQKEKCMSEESFKASNKYFEGTLREYQMTGVKWMETLYLSGINGILADEMGLGKTVQVISFLGKLQTQGEKGIHVICVPLSTIPNWVSEFKRFAPKIPVIVYHGTKNERDHAAAQFREASLQPLKTTEVYPVVICAHHHICPLNMNHFLGIKFIYLIIDEGHRIKNYKSQMAQCVRQISCRNKLLLTGTPLQNDMTELWSLLNFIMPAIFSNLEIFEQLLQTEDLANESVISSNLKENTTVVLTLQRILEPFMLRRLKSDVLSECLPIKSVRVYCQMTEKQIHMYTCALEKNIASLKGQQTDEAEEVLDRKGRKDRARVQFIYDEEQQRMVPVDKTMNNQKELPTVMRNIRFQHPLMLYRRIVNHPYLVEAPLIPGTPNILVDERIITESGKLRILDILLKRLLKDGHKVIIFSTFVVMLDLISDYLQMEDIPYARLTGSDMLETREAEILRFNTNDDLGVFLISTRAGGQGINLTAADTVIFFDSDWNPHADQQAQARCHRIGQTKPVMVYTLVSKNSIDEYILRTGELKLRLEKAIMMDEAKGKIDAGTVQSLLELFKLDNGKIQSNGDELLSKEELDALMDRSELLKQMEDAEKAKTSIKTESAID